MSNELSYFKNQFRIVLNPIRELLEFKRTQLSLEDWTRFMEMTKSSIIANPDQFLGKELPERTVIQQSIEEIFEEFFEEQALAV